jgi:TPR repeat protein
MKRFVALLLFLVELETFAGFARAPRANPVQVAIPAGDDYLDGLKWEKAGQAAVAYGPYKRAADAGNADAAYRIGSLWERGLLGTDAAESLGACLSALPWYQKAATAGSVPAQLKMADWTRTGRTSPVDPEASSEWYRKVLAQKAKRSSAQLAEAQAGLKLLKEAQSAAPVQDTRNQLAQAPPQQFTPTGNDYQDGLKWENAGQAAVAYGPYTRAAAGGNADAAYRVGSLWERGLLGTDAAESLGACLSALPWYQKAASGGNVSAELKMADWTRTGRASPADPAASERWYRMVLVQKAKRSSTQIAEAQSGLKLLKEAEAAAPVQDARHQLAQAPPQQFTLAGDDYQDGLKWEKAGQAAVAYGPYNRASAAGNADAAYRIGSLWERGLLGTDAAESLGACLSASAWYQKAALAGSVPAQLKMADWTRTGRFSQANPLASEGWYRMVLAKKANASRAQLGEAQSGLKLLKEAESATSVQDPRNQPLAQAPQQFTLAGDDYQDGLKWEKAGQAAVAYGPYKRAADAGNTDAAYRIGSLYESGLIGSSAAGSAGACNSAISWYQKAAEGGNVSAQLKMADWTRTGKASPVDLQAASNWYLKALAHGSQIATSQLTEAQAGLKSVESQQEQEIERSRQEQQMAAVQQSAPVQNAVMSAGEQEVAASDAQNEAADLADKISGLESDIEELQSEVEANENSEEQLSHCSGIGAAICQAAAAHAEAKANRARNEIDEKREEIAQLKGEEVTVAARRSTNTADIYSRTAAQNPNPNINDALAQQQAQLAATAAIIRQRNEAEAAQAERLAAQQRAAAEQAELHRQEAAQAAAQEAALKRQQAEQAARIAATRAAAAREPSAPVRVFYSYKGHSYQSYAALLAAARAGGNCAPRPETGEQAACDDTIEIMQSRPAPSPQTAPPPPTNSQPTGSKGPIWVSFAFSAISSVAVELSGDGSYGVGISGNEQTSIDSALNNCNAHVTGDIHCSSGGTWVGSSDGSVKWYALAINRAAIPGDNQHIWSYGEAAKYNSQSDAEQQALATCSKPGADGCAIVSSGSVP